MNFIGGRHPPKKDILNIYCIIPLYILYVNEKTTIFSEFTVKNYHYILLTSKGIGFIIYKLKYV